MAYHIFAVDAHFTGSHPSSPSLLSSERSASSGRSPSTRRRARASPVPVYDLPALEVVFAKPHLGKTAFQRFRIAVLQEFCQIKGITPNHLEKPLKADYKQVIRITHQETVAQNSIHGGSNVIQEAASAPAPARGVESLVDEPIEGIFRPESPLIRNDAAQEINQKSREPPSRVLDDDRMDTDSGAIDEHQVRPN